MVTISAAVDDITELYLKIAAKLGISNIYMMETVF